MYIVQKGNEIKEEGNMYFKTRDYTRALSKYAMVQSYTRSVIPIVNEGTNQSDQMVSSKIGGHGNKDQIE